jgi:anaerobic ribonucleoside-triphosphate reductase activating protein
MMNYGEIKKNDIANGLGVRTTLFVSGCTHHCKGCFQPQTWDFSFGKPYTKEVEDGIIASLSPYYIAGLTLLGGEPMEPANQAALLQLLRRVRAEMPSKNVWCYSGYTFEELTGKTPSRARCGHTDEMLSLIDVLVDGEFKEELKDIRLRFRGSSNQRVIDVGKTLASGEIVLFEF